MPTHDSRMPDEQPAIRTGIYEIDQEMDCIQGLLGQVQALRDRVAARIRIDRNETLTPDCANLLYGIVSKLLNFLFEHSMAEEEIMRASGYALDHSERYKLHVEDHANIAQELVAVIVELNNTQSLRELQRVGAVATGWFNQHIPEHDLAFAARAQAS